MSDPNPLARLSIPPEKKSAPRSRAYLPLFWVGLVLLGLLIAAFAAQKPKELGPQPSSNAQPSATPPPPEKPSPASDDTALTATGYIIPRERLELSARFPGTVESVRVKRGDSVKKGDVLVKLVDDEQRHLLEEAQGRQALAEANLANAEANYKRQRELSQTGAATADALDEAQRALDAARAEITIAQGQLKLAQTKLDWCTIRSPINGTILEKVVDENELIIPQGFGLPNGPGTTLLAIADLTDLQVEIDVNELDLKKVRLGQRCRITPEAYPDRSYEGQVEEIAPEADRQKGTLEVKVRIEKPDRFLTPELNAKVEFLAE